MSIQYAGGTIINNLYVQPSGTRAEIADWINTQLQAAGWTSATNSSHNYTLTSATTSQGLAFGVNVLDSGGGTCAQLKFQNAAGTLKQATAHYLKPVASKVWRIIANQYQFFILVPGSTAANGFLASGVPYLPASQVGVAWNCFWSCSDGPVDVPSNVFDTFRNRLQCVGSSGSNNYCAGHYCQFNELALSIASNTGAIANAWIRLVVDWSPYASQSSCYQWHDGSQLMREPFISWGTVNTTDIAAIRGQMWDSFIASDAHVMDEVIMYDGHVFWAITNNNLGNNNAEYDTRGTLFVRVG